MKVLYDIDLTPHVVTMSPKYGSVEGGTSVTFRTSDLGNTIVVADVTVYIDSVACSVDSVTQVTEGLTTYSDIVCTTGARPGAYNADPTLHIYA